MSKQNNHHLVPEEKKGLDEDVFEGSDADVDKVVGIKSTVGDAGTVVDGTVEEEIESVDTEVVVGFEGETESADANVVVGFEGEIESVDTEVVVRRAEGNDVETNVEVDDTDATSFEDVDEAMPSISRRIWYIRDTCIRIGPVSGSLSH